MKKQLIILFFLTLLCYPSCQKKNDDNLKPEKLNLRNVNLTSCSNNTKKSSSNQFTITIQAVNDNYLKILNYNAEFCCESDSMDIELEFRNDTILIKEIDLDPMDWCYCPHYLEFEIGPLNIRKYTLQLIESQSSYIRDTILLNFSFTNTLNITDYN